MPDPTIDNDQLICPICSDVAEDPVLADISSLTGDDLPEQLELVCRFCRNDFLPEPYWPEGGSAAV